MNEKKNTIPSGWKETTLYHPEFGFNYEQKNLFSLAEWINGMTFKEVDFSVKGKPVIKIAEIKNGISSQTQYTDSVYDEKYYIQKGDMLFCWSGQPETSIDVFWWRDGDGWLNQHIYKVIPKIEQDYFFYMLKYIKPNFIQIAKNKQTTGLGHVTKADLEAIIVSIPSFDEQRAIAAVLSSLDKKIELLRSQNKTLENIAQVLFKRWFVEFEFPDKNGKPYKSSGGKMTDSEPGKIPEGWRVGRLGDVVDLTIGRTPPRKEPKWFSTNPNDIKWLSIRDLGNAGTYVFNTAEYLTDNAIEEHRIQIVPQNTVLISFKLTVGRVAITLEEMATNEAIAHLRLSETSVVSSEYLYLYFKVYDFNTIGSTSSIATAFNSESLRELNMLIPENGILKAFEKIAKPTFNKIANNTIQIQALSFLRDAILPKLMKGEVRVKGIM